AAKRLKSNGSKTTSSLPVCEKIGRACPAPTGTDYRRSTGPPAIYGETYDSTEARKASQATFVGAGHAWPDFFPGPPPPVVARPGTQTSNRNADQVNCARTGYASSVLYESRGQSALVYREPLCAGDHSPRNR